MFGFPIGNGNAGFNDFVEKFTNNADSGFPNIQQREVFYSVRDGNWNDAAVWQTASGRVGKLPTINDDVFIKHTITITNSGNICNNINITGTLNTDTTARDFQIFGEIKCLGTLSFGTNNQAHVLYLYGTGDNSYINNFITGTSSRVEYRKNGGVQYVLNLPYIDLTITGIGIKYLTSDTIVRNFSLATTSSGGSFFDLLNYSFTVLGTTALGNGSILHTTTLQRPIFMKSGTGGSTIFVGLITHYGDCYWDFSMCNVDVEFRGGYSRPNSGTGASIYGNDLPQLGTGTLILSTNNQTINNNSNNSTAVSTWFFKGEILISGAINVTFTTDGYAYGFNLIQKINGNNASSKLINRGPITFATQVAAENSMTTGIVDFTTFSNTILYSGNYSATIPSYFTTFHNLIISGTGTKTLGVNTTLNGSLSCVTNSNFQCSIYNLIVNGTTGIDASSVLNKNSTGNLLFVGRLQSTQTGGGNINFNGNPNVEFRNGISVTRASLFVTGTGTWSFTTNNQTFTDDAINQLYQLNCAIIIASGITLTMGSSLTGIAYTNGYKINSTFNGSSPTSVLINRIGLTLTSDIMSTGVIDITTYANSISYIYNTTLPYSSYHGLGIISTTFTPISNLTLAGLYVTGILQLSTYNLSVNGITNMPGGNILKSGAGNVLFVGAIQNVNTINTSGGNANVECRGGISGTGGGSFSCGTGVWSFTTNNQSISSLGGTFNSKVLISGNITITLGASGNTTTFNDSVDGDTANSKLLVAASSFINYKSPIQPMVTGILDTSTNLNTWIYGLNNQDIKGGPTTLAKQVYRNLTLNGTGVKTLQGYVSVQNTYTLTAPATLALNGFTLTNP